MTDRVDELLCKLEELDPKTCSMLHWNGFRSLLLDNGNPTPHSLRIDGYVLQCTIQDAISSRAGWSWRLDSVMLCNCYIAVVTIENECWTDDKYQGNGDSPAGAILLAYVTALEAQK